MEPPQQIYSVTEADFLENEEFDFDLPVSPVLTNTPTQAIVVHETSTEEGEEDEDEVFFGPIGFKEKCVAKKTELTKDTTERCKPMSPLTTEQYVEIFKEATKVALLLQEHATDKTQSAEQETGKSDEPVNQLTVSISELALKPSNETNITPNKTEMKQFKRAAKKDMRSPRRTTYTICVSPAGHPPPQLPTAKDCVSSLVKDKPNDIKFTAKKVDDSKKPVAVVKKSRLPAKRSGIPKTSGLRKPKPVLQKVGVKKQQSPPKRTRLASGESIEGLNVSSSPAPSDSSENNMVCSGKRRIPGSNNPVQNGLGKSIKNGQQSAANIKKNGTSQLPGSKLGLLKPGVIPRKTLAAARPSKLAKSTSSSGTSKLQPMKATLALNNKKTTAAKLATPKMQIPFTPVIEEKNVVPKRLLSSGSLSATKHVTPRTTRAYSVDSAIKAKNPHLKTPVQKKSSLTVTPQKSSQKPGGSVTGSSRRRSGIPTPTKRSVSSTSKLSSISSVTSNASPRTLPMHSQMTRIPSPIETPPAPSISPGLPTEMARQDYYGASPELTSAPTYKKQIDGRAALAEIQQSYAPSPQLDLLIKLDTPSPVPTGKMGSLLDLNVGLSKKCLTPINMNSTAKENLIDLL